MTELSDRACWRSSTGVILVRGDPFLARAGQPRARELASERHRVREGSKPPGRAARYPGRALRPGRAPARPRRGLHWQAGSGREAMAALAALPDTALVVAVDRRHAGQAKRGRAPGPRRHPTPRFEPAALGEESSTPPACAGATCRRLGLFGEDPAAILSGWQLAALDGCSPPARQAGHEPRHGEGRLRPHRRSRRATRRGAGHRQAAPPRRQAAQRVMAALAWQFTLLAGRGVAVARAGRVTPGADGRSRSPSEDASSRAG